MLSVLIFAIPILTGIIAWLAKLKNPEGKTVWTQITFWGYTIITLSLAYFLLGIKDLTDKETKEITNKGTIDSLRIDLKYTTAQLSSDSVFFRALGYNIDSLKKANREGKISIDSLLKKANNPIISNSDPTSLDVCVSPENLRLKHSFPLDSINVDICNGTQPIHTIKLYWEFVGVRYGVYKLTKFKKPVANPYLFYVENGLPPNGSLRTHVPLYSEYIPTDTVFLYVHGTYKDIKDKVYHLSRFYFMDDNKSFVFMNDIFLTKLKEYLHKEGIL